MLSMGLYGSLILITSLLAKLYVEEKETFKRYLWLILIILLPSIIAGLRFQVGTDYLIHESVYLDIFSGADIGKHAEIGYILLNHLVIFLHGNYQIVLFVITAISMSCYMAALNKFKKYISIPIAILFYFLLYYQMSLNYIRQLLAASIAFYGSSLYLSNQKKLGILLTIIAASFHITALIYLPTFLFSKYLSEDQYQKKRCILYIALIVIIFTYPLFLLPILDLIEEDIPQLAYFFNYLEYDYRMIGLGLFRYLLMIVPIILVYHHMKKTMKYYVQIVILGFILWLTSYVTKMEFYRISHTFLIVLPVVLSYCYKYADLMSIKLSLKIPVLNKGLAFYNNHRILIYRSAIILLLVFFWIYDYYILGAHETIPYQTIFGGLL